MSMKAGFLLLAIGVIQVSSEYVEPKFIEDAIEEQSKLQGPSRIVSGWEAELGQHPHQANLRQVNAVGSINTCGGSFVHYEWLITAAHCTAQRVTIVVRGGLVSLTRPEYFFETTLYWNHPSYDNDLVSTVQTNDISLVKLQRPATFTKNLQPIRIQRSKDAFNNYENLVLYASGHGRTWTDGTAPEVLRWVYLRGVSNAYCSSLFINGLINDNSICARYYNVTSQSTCQGDSGGPLVHVNAQGDKFLVGVASFVAGAPAGCHSGYPAGFIRPGPFHSWFKEVTGINFDEEEGQTTTNLPPPESEETTESNETEESNETVESNETEESNETKESNETEESNETKESNETEESKEDSNETEESKEDSNEDDSDSSDDSDSDSSDDDSDEGTRRHPKLQVKVKVKVNIKNYKGDRHSIKEVIKK